MVIIVLSKVLNNNLAPQLKILYETLVCVCVCVCVCVGREGEIKSVGGSGAS